MNVFEPLCWLHETFYLLLCLVTLAFWHCMHILAQSAHSLFICGWTYFSVINFTVARTPGCDKLCKDWNACLQYCFVTNGRGMLVDMSQKSPSFNPGIGTFSNFSPYPPFMYCCTSSSFCANFFRQFLEADGFLYCLDLWKGVRDYVGLFFYIPNVCGELRYKFRVSNLPGWTLQRVFVERKRYGCYIGNNRTGLSLYLRTTC